MQQAIVRVFVIHRQHAVICFSWKRKKMHAVVMHARLLHLRFGAVAGIGLHRGAIGDSVAPAV